MVVDPRVFQSDDWLDPSCFFVYDMYFVWWYFGENSLSAGLQFFAMVSATFEDHGKAKVWSYTSWFYVIDLGRLSFEQCFVNTLLVNGLIWNVKIGCDFWDITMLIKPVLSPLSVLGSRFFFLTLLHRISHFPCFFLKNWYQLMQCVFCM